MANRETTGERESAQRREEGDGSRTAAARPSESELPVTRRWGTPSGQGRFGFTSPFSLMRELSDEMSRIFTDFGGAERGMRAFEGTWSPQVDVLRRGDDVVVRADLPGLRKDDITVDVTENVLTIRGERREEQKEEREGYYWHERSEGSFMRSIPLPEGANAERASARFDNGVLEVSVPAPTREEESRGRRIEIR
jgi:HSP20 family protein